MTGNPTLKQSHERIPRDDEIDVYGLTHPGKVRERNEDHFLICSLRKAVEIHHTSLPDAESLARYRERIAFLAMVADGVGSSSDGEAASRNALAAVTRYVAESMHCYYTSDVSDSSSFTDALMKAALSTHAELLKQAEERQDPQGLATTLTLWIGKWPTGYLVQVGDSRCYLYSKGKLTQLSRDQTVAQDLIDSGVVSRSDASQTQWAHVLSSSIGGPESAPAITMMEQSWGDVGLICTDGLTKHVSNEQIEERLANMTSAKQVCEALLQDALDDGGRDNISIIVGRAVRKD